LALPTDHAFYQLKNHPLKIRTRKDGGSSHLMAGTIEHVEDREMPHPRMKNGFPALYIENSKPSSFSKILG
jgi:hypothetical protein